jgi:hypothetical protein
MSKVATVSVAHALGKFMAIFIVDGDKSDGMDTCVSDVSQKTGLSTGTTPLEASPLNESGISKVNNESSKIL